MIQKNCTCSSAASMSPKSNQNWHNEVCRFRTKTQKTQKNGAPRCTTMHVVGLRKSGPGAAIRCSSCWKLRIWWNIVVCRIEDRHVQSFERRHALRGLNHEVLIDFGQTIGAPRLGVNGSLEKKNHEKPSFSLHCFILYEECTTNINVMYIIYIIISFASPSSHLLSAHVGSRLLLEAMSPADRLALTRWMANGANGPMD